MTSNKLLKVLNMGTNKLLIRDSARDANQSGEIWIDNIVTGQPGLHLAGDMCMYFTC